MAVKRVQVYLDEQLWSGLRALAGSRKTTVSALVREALREAYPNRREERIQAMRDFVGIRKGRREFTDAVAYIRGLRRSRRAKA